MTNENEEQKETCGCGCGEGSCCGGSSKWMWIILALAVIGVLVAKNMAKKEAPASAPAVKEAPMAAPTANAAVPAASAAQEKILPRLVDLGANKCVPCKMMAPILDELKTNYVGKLEVEFIDVWEQPDAGEKYAIKLIPTQIFFDAQGKEVFRHEGFFSKEDILAKWKELGVDLVAVSK